MFQLKCWIPPIFCLVKFKLLSHQSTKKIKLPLMSVSERNGENKFGLKWCFFTHSSYMLNFWRHKYKVNNHRVKYCFWRMIIFSWTWSDTAKFWLCWGNKYYIFDIYNIFFWIVIRQYCHFIFLLICLLCFLSILSSLYLIRFQNQKENMSL